MYAELLNHMVESFRRKDVIEKLKSCLETKSGEIKELKRKIRFYESIRTNNSNKATVVQKNQENPGIEQVPDNEQVPDSDVSLHGILCTGFMCWEIGKFED